MTNVILYLMKCSIAVSIFTLVIILAVPPFIWIFQFASGVLYENGTCTNENITRMSNRPVNTSGTVEDFLKSLPSDNTILAEIVCQDDSNYKHTK
jgi:hypothetical protein